MPIFMEYKKVQIVRYSRLDCVWLLPACVAAACARDEHLGQGLQAGQGLPLVGGGDEAVRHVSRCVTTY